MPEEVRLRDALHGFQRDLWGERLRLMLGKLEGTLTTFASSSEPPVDPSTIVGYSPKQRLLLSKRRMRSTGLPAIAMAAHPDAGTVLYAANHWLSNRCPATAGTPLLR